MQNHKKFTPETKKAKQFLKQCRLNSGLSINKAAAKIGISRKKMEDREATRPYGCWLELDMIIEMLEAYGYTLIDFAEEMEN